MTTREKAAATVPPMGRAIAEARMDLRWTQEELGRHLGVSEKTISRWELGEVKPRVGDRPRLMEALATAPPHALAQMRAAFGMAPAAPVQPEARSNHARFALEAALFAMAEATDCSPRAVRAGAFALLSHLAMAGIGLEEARAMLAGK
jgi:transcriptional regulator with XRE-family HTH domain